MRSVIEANAEHPHCQDYRSWIYNQFRDTLFKEGGNLCSEIERNPTNGVPMGFVSWSQLRMLRRRLTSPFVQFAVEKGPCVRRSKEFQEKGLIVPSQSHCVSPGFLVPNPLHK